MKLRKTFGPAAAALALLVSLGHLSARADEPQSPTGGPAGEGGVPLPPLNSWSFHGPLGHFDQAQLQRGFQVYREVCSNCHSLNLIAFRNLGDPGGPGFSESQIRALAAEYKIKDGPNDAGDMFERPGRPSDHFPWAFPNAQAARAAIGALPPDMSVLAKARSFSRGFPYFLTNALTQYQEAGPDYIVALMQGYTHDDDPNYNEYFPGHHIGMPKPLSDGAVDYSDGSPKVVAQYAKDVAAFLMWAAEPKLDERKRIGFRVIAFLIVFAGLLYFVKRKIWANVHGDVAFGDH
jgi:cytochrome c1